MKKIIYLLILLFTSIVSFSQVNFGIKGGLNISKSNDSKTRFAGYGGARLYVPISGKFSFDPEFLFSGKGFTIPGDDDQRTAYRLNYITTPLLFSYLFDCKTRLLAGAEVGYQLSAKMHDSKDNETSDAKSEYPHSFDVGLAVGVDYKISKRLHAEVRYVHGLTTIHQLNFNGTTYNNGYNRVFQVGMVYDLKK